MKFIIKITIISPILFASLVPASSRELILQFSCCLKALSCKLVNLNSAPPHKTVQNHLLDDNL